MDFVINVLEDVYNVHLAPFAPKLPQVISSFRIMFQNLVHHSVNNVTQKDFALLLMIIIMDSFRLKMVMTLS
jgi:hypothetical protein